MTPMSSEPPGGPTPEWEGHDNSRFRILDFRLRGRRSIENRKSKIENSWGAKRRMRVLVTGGAGFLGSHLCDRLLAEGNEVIAMDNLITGNLRNIAHLSGEPGFQFVRHDVSQFISVEGALDAVLHFASPASPIDYLELPIQTLKVGSLGTHNALGLAMAK